MTVVAIVGPGGDLHRQLGVAAAEAGCKVALATISSAQDQDFAVNSIANELWVMRTESFVCVQTATDPIDAASFADEVIDRFGACDVAVIVSAPTPNVEADEFSADELVPMLNEQVNAPFLATQAFGRVMQRQGRGTILLVMPNKEGLPAAIVGGALKGLASNTGRLWGNRGVWVDCIGPDAAMKRLIAALVVQ